MTTDSRALLREPDSRLFATLRTQFIETLSGDELELFDLVSMSDFLALASVIERERPLARVVVTNPNVARMVELMHGLGISASTSVAEIETLSSPVEGTDHVARFVPATGSPDRRKVIYAALTEDIGSGAAILDLNGGHELLGELLRYPPCCRRAYTRGCERNVFDRTPDAMVDTGPFDALLNPLLPILHGLSLLFHFPCNGRCQASMDIARHRLGYLCQRSPAAAGLAVAGRGIGLYGPDFGSALATRFTTVSKGRFMIQAIETRSRHTRQRLKESANPLELHVSGSHAFEFPALRQAYSGPEAFSARFE